MSTPKLAYTDPLTYVVWLQYVLIHAMIKQYHCEGALACSMQLSVTVALSCKAWHCVSRALCCESLC